MVVQSEGVYAIDSQYQNTNERRQRLRQRFQVVKKLGQGTYGKVQLAINRETKQEVAIKTIRKAKIENGQDLLRIRREIQIMSSIQHPHIIHIYEVFENCEKIVLVMQYASGGELYDYLGCHKKLPEKEARRIFRQVAAAIYYCHKYKICHRDLKLENILLDDKGNAKIADFGLSNVFDERKKLHTFCGSPLYASPEIVKGTPYSGPEVDCWSLGVLLYTMVYGAMPFDGSNFKRLVKQISEGDFYEPKLKSKASGIIRRLLTVDVAKRATIKDACTDEWVNEGYDHLLLKVANDMACLTPVTLNSVLTLSSLPAASTTGPQYTTIPSNFIKIPPLAKNDSIFINDNVMPAAKARQNVLRSPDLTTTYSSEQNYKTIKDTFSGHPSYESQLSKGTSEDVRKVLETILSEVERTEKSDPCDLQGIYASSTNGPILENGISLLKSEVSNEKLDYFKIQGSRPNTAGGSLEENRKITDLLNGHDTEDKTKPKRFAYFENISTPTPKQALIENNRDGKESARTDFFADNIPGRDQSLKLQRESTVEKFRAWRASLENTKSNNPESIVPIFDVTSVIPRRLNDEVDLRDKGQVVKDELKNNFIRTNCHNVPDIEHLKNKFLSSNSDLYEPSVYKTGFSVNNERSKTLLNEVKTITKEQNDMMFVLNQICKQRKISSERKQQNAANVLKQSLNDKVCRLLEKDVKQTPSNETKVISDIDTQLLVYRKTDSEGITSQNDEKPVNGSGEIGEVEASEAQNRKPDSETINGTQEVRKQISDDVIRDADKVVLNISDENDRPSLQCSGTILSDPHNTCAGEEGSATQDLSESPAEVPSLPCILDSNNESKAVDQENQFHGDISEAKLCDLAVEETEPENSSRYHPENDEEDVEKNFSDTPSFVHQGFPDKMNHDAPCRPARKLNTRSCSVDDDCRMNDLEKILRRPRKYSLCALLAASFELERLTCGYTKKECETAKKAPGKVEIPKSFDPSSESECNTPVEKKEIVLFPSISVAENKEKLEKKIEKVKLSALSMKVRRKSEAGARKKLKKYTRSCTDVLQCTENVNVFNGPYSSFQKSCPLSIGSTDDSSQNSGSLVYASTDTDLTNGDVGFSYERSVFFRGSEEADEFHNEFRHAEAAMEMHVPITRCCRKMTFLPKFSEVVEQGYVTTDDERFCVNDPNMQMQVNVQEACLNLSLSDCKEIAKKKIFKTLKCVKKELANECNGSAHYTEQTGERLNGSDLNPMSLESMESLNSSSLDKDSSDNEDEDLNTMLFGSQLEACESGDLWKLLKSINNDLSQQLKKAKRGPSKSMYSRSKSQECKITEDHQYCDKILTRSRSKEEKSKSRATGKNSDAQGVTDDFSGDYDFDHAHPKELRRCFTSVENSSLPDNELESPSKTEIGLKYSNKGSVKAKYHSLSNLDDPRSFLENTLQRDLDENQDSSGCLQSLDDTFDFKTQRLKADIASPIVKKISLYGTIRPRKHGKNERSTSQFSLNGEEHLVSDQTAETMNVWGSDKKHSNRLKSKALSDLDVSYREAESFSKSHEALSLKDTGDQIMRYAKSLGSKLNLEPRSILSDSLKKTSCDRRREETMPRKCGRKVSFTGNCSKPKNSKFALEAVAKAQIALNSLERNVTDNSTSDESGTLLEALKTHGYKSLISQRLQQNEPEDDEYLNKRYSFMRNQPNQQCYGDFLSLFKYSTANTDSSEYSKLLQWRRILSSQANLRQENSDVDYSDFVKLNGLYGGAVHGKAHVAWCKMPNMWLYQNADDLRSTRPYEERDEPIDPADSDFNHWQPETKYEFPEYSNPNNIIGMNRRMTEHSKMKCKFGNENDFSYNAEACQDSKTSENTIEKLAMKIQALKNRCHQKSYDDFGSSRNTSSLELSQTSDKGPVNRRSTENTSEVNDFSFPSDLNAIDKQDDEESVSDRIWRKSFYSRFNEMSISRRRRSGLFDIDYPNDLLLKPTKLHNTLENGTSEYRRKETKKSVFSSRETGSATVGEGMATNESKFAADNPKQNIPSRVEDDDNARKSKLETKT